MFSGLSRLVGTGLIGKVGIGLGFSTVAFSLVMTAEAVGLVVGAFTPLSRR